MASRLISKPPQPPAKPINIDNYDIDDDDPFADSGDEAAKQSETAAAQSKKRKDASGLGIDEAVSVSKKPRVPRVKLDETRLLSDNGIPKLRSKAQNLRFKGKGHEFSDTARLLSFYQLWLDDLFPKAKFVDALSMVEKAGHKNQLRLKRIQWIGEGQPKPAGLDDDDLFGDSNQPEGQERDPALFPAKLAPIFQSSLDKSTPAPTGDGPFAEEDIYGASPKRQTDAAPAITSLFGNGGNGGNAQANDEPDEDDLDALMAEEEAQRTASTSIFGNGTTSTLGNGKTTLTVQTRHGLGNNDDDEDDLDALMAEAEADSLNTKHTKPVNARPSKRAIVDDNDDDDDDLDALMAEAEAEGSAKKPPPHTPNTTGTKENGGVNHSIGEDEEAALAEMEGLWE